MTNRVEDAEATMIRNLEEKTGKSLATWIDIVRSSALSRHGELVDYLKREHGLTHGYANLIVHKAKQATGETPSAEPDLIDAQYAGPKSALRPIYHAIVQAVGAFGDDVEISPKKTYVSLRRNKQFAIVQPTTKTRVDVGLNLKDTPPSGPLEPAGSFNAMVSHRVRLSQASEVDEELLRWLRQAYDMA